jgi:hypothetical protein
MEISSFITPGGEEIKSLLYIYLFPLVLLTFINRFSYHLSSFYTLTLMTFECPPIAAGGPL